MNKLETFEQCVAHLETCLAMEKPHKFKRVSQSEGIDENGDKWMLFPGFARPSCWKRTEN